MMQYMNMEYNIRIPPEQNPPEQNFLPLSKAFSTEPDYPPERIGFKNQLEAGQTMENSPFATHDEKGDFFKVVFANMLAIIYATGIRTKRDTIRAEILSSANLPYDFNGDGGHAPTAKDIKNAESFIQHIPDAGIDTVRIMVAGDGDVGFEWEGDFDLEIGFLKGSLSFFGDTPDSKTIAGTEENYDGNVPEALRSLMKTLFPN